MPFLDGRESACGDSQLCRHHGRRRLIFIGTSFSTSTSTGGDGESRYARRYCGTPTSVTLLQLIAFFLQEFPKIPSNFRHVFGVARHRPPMEVENATFN